MCGIVSTVNHSDEVVHDMLLQIEHRGRDNREIFECGNVHLGHNRLSINDVSEAGNQPFIWNDYALVVNGEIWNYPQLRKEYEERGYTFFNNSESEIILYLYKENELKRLEGMFSFVLHDSLTNELVISRDWVGKIPLYIYNNDTNILIASEMKSILKILPQAECKFVPKNSVVRINTITGSVHIDKDYYFTWTPFEEKEFDQDEVNKKTYELLDTAVEKRLLSDVKVGTCLSGGIDSSVITYLLSKKVPDIVSYTVKFDEDSRDLMFARMVAEHINVPLVEVEIPRDPEELKRKFLETIKVIEYPSTVQMEVGILQSYVAERMAEDGVKVAFSGEGSDESYGSYGTFRMFSKKPDWSDVRKKLFEKQYYGNLLRGNNIFMNYGTIELRCPFFDLDFLDYTTNLTQPVLDNSGNQWKKPLAEAFRGHLPDEVCDQEKRAFQKGTNFKEYIEDVILNDTELNFRNRKKLFHCIGDNFERIFGFKHKGMRDTLSGTENGFGKWT